MRDIAYWVFIAITFIAVAIIWFVIGFIPAEKARSMPEQNETPLQRVGTYGDSFGMVNSLFSGLAFAGVVAALCFQHREQGAARESAKESKIAADKAKAHETELVLKQA